MWLLLAGLALLTGDVLSQGFVQFQSAPLLPIAPIAFHNRPVFGPTVTTGNFHNNFAIRGDAHAPSGNPCHPSPCGPNTRCEVSNRSVARCLCLADYVPDGNTVIGCKRQCTTDTECPADNQCRRFKCTKVCQSGACGINAECKAFNNVARCSCPTNYNGNPEVRCNRINVQPPNVRNNVQYRINPCGRNPCGTNANCNERNDVPVCSCPLGYEGDPLTNCIKGECSEHHHCSGHLACKELKCIDPCKIPSICGHQANCLARRNQPICSCPQNYIGNALNSCRRITERDVCNRETCGANTNCEVSTERTGALRATCSCKENYIGHPLTGCQYECTSNNECNTNQICSKNRCRNPCSVDLSACGTDAICSVGNHRAICTCHEYFKGEPYGANGRCYAECTAHRDCAGNKACIKFECKDPCENACGVNADCKVENNIPVCSCPRDFTGHPFESCRRFTLDDLCAKKPCGRDAECHPGKDTQGNDRPVCSCPRGFIGNALVSCARGECLDHSSCSDNKSCYEYICQNSCYVNGRSVCGDNANCAVKNHQPVCSCPSGYVGSPLTSCTLSEHAVRANFVSGHSRVAK